jgi:hypothetical protein
MPIGTKLYFILSLLPATGDFPGQGEAGIIQIVLPLLFCPGICAASLLAFLI